MYIKRTNIGKLNFSFVFRHRFEKYEHKYEKLTHWRGWELGLFFRRSIIVGKKNANDVKQWEKNYVGDYMFGINLLIIKMWINLDYDGLHLKIK